MNIIAIVCKNFNNTIGIKNKNNLVYNIPFDMKIFKKYTLSSSTSLPNLLIMGKNTWLSLKKPFLPNRINCVITSDYIKYQTLYNNYNENLKFFPNIPSFINYACSNITIFNDIYVIGGQTIYEYFINYNLIDYYFISKIETPNNNGDVLFPYLDYRLLDVKNTELYHNIDAYDNTNNEQVKLDYSFTIYNNSFSIKDKLNYLDYNI